MRITIESTDRVVEVQADGARVPARVWEGLTSKGVAVVVLVTRIAAHLEDDQAEFEADLRETTRPASPHTVEAFPLRLIL